MSSSPPSVHWEAPNEPAGPAPGIEFAGYGARFVAYVLDGLVMATVEIPILVVGVIVLFSGATFVDERFVSIDPGSVAGFLICLLIDLVVGLLYFPFFWARGGQTLGMRPFGLRIVRDLDGGRIGWGTALLRLIGLFVAGSVLYLGYIWVFIDKGVAVGRI